MSSLDLRGRGLTRLPREMLGARIPSSIDAQQNKLQTIDFPLEGVETLDLSYNTIKSLEAASSRTLLSLKLSNNVLSHVSALDFPKLSTLDLSHNALRDASALGKLTGLVTLNLAFNALSSIPNLSACSLLRSLNVDNNRIFALRADVLPAGLQELGLSNNALAELPQLKYLAATRHLGTLTLEGNPFLVQARRLNISVRVFVLSICPRIRIIDGAPIAAAERTAAQRLFRTADGSALDTALLALLGPNNEHALLEYLSTACVLPGGGAEGVGGGAAVGTAAAAERSPALRRDGSAAAAYVDTAIARH